MTLSETSWEILDSRDISLDDYSSCNEIADAISDLQSYSSNFDDGFTSGYEMSCEERSDALSMIDDCISELEEILSQYGHL